MIDKLLLEYADKFHENFPLMVVRFSDDKLEKVLRECLKTGKPYEFDAETKKLLENPDVDF